MQIACQHFSYRWFSVMFSLQVWVQCRLYEPSTLCIFSKNVSHYIAVLPRFDTKLTCPSALSVVEKSAQIEVSAQYVTFMAYHVQCFWFFMFRGGVIRYKPQLLLIDIQCVFFYLPGMYMVSHYLAPSLESAAGM